MDASPLAQFLQTRDDNGCLQCPPTIGDCPPCPKGQTCQLKSPTCTQCAQYYCTDIEGSGSRKVPIGGIVGGVIGGVLFFGLIGALAYYYYFIYQKKARLMLEEDNFDFMDDDLSQEFAESLKYEDELQRGPSLNSGSGASNETAAGAVGGVAGAAGVGPLERPVRPRRAGQKRLSAYESFTKPTAIKSKQQQLEARQRRLRQQQIVQQANKQLKQHQHQQHQHQQHQHQQQQPPQHTDIYLDLASSNRNSIATTISSTNASNILPIAYIPGVTVRPTKNNTRSIYSYETDSIFSDLNTIENASIIGDVIHANQTVIPEQQPATSTTQPGTMTAIKAQPRLVNVDRIEEKDEDVTDEEDDDSIQEEGTENFNISNKFRIVEDPTEDEGDSDVDSDIIEINRATSVKTQKRPSLVNVKPYTSENEILIGLATNHPAPSIPLQYLDDDGKDAESTIGSFVLDVQVDHGDFKESMRSPFEDPR